MSEFTDQYEALTTGAGVTSLVDWSVVELTGDERATFLHNFCTNEIRKLPVGSGCEAFITSVQGKTLAHVLVFCRADSLLLVAAPKLGGKIVAHLDRYLINEPVELHDLTSTHGVLLCAGAKSDALLTERIAAPLPEERLACIATQLDGQPATIARVDLTGPVGFLVVGSAAGVCAWSASLQDAGAVRCDEAAWEAARIEAGTPLYGRDISDENLPQEIGRDDLAISFVKGCYLGQETVARIDAMGHVNKRLVGLRSQASELPPLGSELTVDGRAIGTITSATFSPKLQATLALAQVRRKHAEPGSRLDSAVGEMQVVALPV